MSWMPLVFCWEQIKQENGRNVVGKATRLELQTSTTIGIAGDWPKERPQHGQMLLSSLYLETVALSGWPSDWGNQISLGHLCHVLSNVEQSGGTESKNDKLLISPNHLHHEEWQSRVLWLPPAITTTSTTDVCRALLHLMCLLEAIAMPVEANPTTAAQQWQETVLFMHLCLYDAFDFQTLVILGTTGLAIFPEIAYS